MIQTSHEPIDARDWCWGRTTDNVLGFCGTREHALKKATDMCRSGGGPAFIGRRTLSRPEYHISFSDATAR